MSIMHRDSKFKLFMGNQHSARLMGTCSAHVAAFLASRSLQHAEVAPRPMCEGMGGCDGCQIDSHMDLDLPWQKGMWSLMSDWRINICFIIML